MKDPYQILEVSPDASIEQIREQYRLLVQAWHPDKFRNPKQRIKAEERMNTERLAHDVGAHAQAFATNEALLTTLSKEMSSGDVIVFMSPSSFSGIQHELARRVSSNRARSAPTVSV